MAGPDADNSGLFDEVAPDQPRVQLVPFIREHLLMSRSFHPPLALPWAFFMPYSSFFGIFFPQLLTLFYNSVELRPRARTLWA